MPVSRVLAASAALAVLLSMLSGCSNIPEERALAPIADMRTVPVAVDDETKADDKFEPLTSGVNLTPNYRERFNHPAVAISADETAALKPYRILVVHGFMGEVGFLFEGFLDKFNKEQGLIDYFKDQKRVFNELNLDYSIPEFKSARVDRCGTKIADAIAASDRPVIILSHSKGGIDTLDALIKLDAQGKLNKVAGWISMQGVFYGTPDADHCVNSNFKSLYAKISVKCLGGHYDAVKDLMTPVRAEYDAEHHDAIAKVVREVPTICFATWQPELHFGEMSDGQVPVRSAIIPGADYVAKSNIGHAQTVIHAGGKFDRVTLTKTLLGMMGEKLKAAQQPVPKADPKPEKASEPAAFEQK